MKARLEWQDQAALVVVEVSERPLVDSVMVPAALLSGLQAAQHALDRAETAVLDHLADSGQLPPGLARQVEPRVGR